MHLIGQVCLITWAFLPMVYTITGPLTSQFEEKARDVISSLDAHAQTANTPDFRRPRAPLITFNKSRGPRAYPVGIAPRSIQEDEDDLISEELIEDQIGDPASPINGLWPDSAEGGVDPQVFDIDVHSEARIKKNEISDSSNDEIVKENLMMISEEEGEDEGEEEGNMQRQNNGNKDDAIDVNDNNDGIPDEHQAMKNPAKEQAKGKGQSQPSERMGTTNDNSNQNDAPLPDEEDAKVGQDDHDSSHVSENVRVAADPNTAVDSKSPHLSLDLFNKGSKELMDMKENIKQQLDREWSLLESNEELDDAERALHKQLLEIKRKHMMFADTLLAQAMKSIQHTMEDDFSSVKEDGLSHVHEIQDVALHLTEEYKGLLAGVNAYNSDEDAVAAAAVNDPANVGDTGIVQDTLKDVSNAADDVESQLKQEKFKEAHDDGALLDTVVVIEEAKTDMQTSKSDTQGDELNVPLHLVDSNNDEFVLTKSHDATSMIEDHHLLTDLVLMICGCFVGGSFFHILHMPSFFGFVCGGIVLGPVGMNKINVWSMVQMETIAQFGIFLILFVLGLEFNLQKLTSTLRVSVWGSFAMLVIDVSLVGALAVIAGQSLASGVLIGFCTCLASTAVVLKVLPADEVESAYGRTVIGVLVMQDLYFGLLITLLPMLSGGQSSVDAAWQLLHLGQSLAIFGAGCFVLVNYIMSHFLYALTSMKNDELMLFGLLFVCFCALKTTELIGLSPELGCFAAGVIISSRHQSPHEAIAIVDPIKDLFAALFFATIGLHVYPSFLWSQWRLLMGMTLALVCIKFVAGFLVLFRGFGQHPVVAGMAALGLSQISEFAFVIAGRAKSMRIISREVYYLMLGTTTLSLVIVPLLFTFARIFAHSRFQSSLFPHKHTV